MILRLYCLSKGISRLLKLNARKTRRLKALHAKRQVLSSPTVAAERQPLLSATSTFCNMEKATGKIAGTLDDLGGGSDKAKQMQQK